ncbi:hypothetical protein EDC01DRAFT_628274 [Geopyxis carbonaria]|nr:hypothetical protein EDC01DRAFT_628274 [Geopyxis carbonaria]
MTPPFESFGKPHSTPRKISSRPWSDSEHDSESSSSSSRGAADGFALYRQRVEAGSRSVCMLRPHTYRNTDSRRQDPVELKTNTVGAAPIEPTLTLDFALYRHRVECTPTKSDADDAVAAQEKRCGLRCRTLEKLRSTSRLRRSSTATENDQPEPKLVFAAYRQCVEVVESTTAARQWLTVPRASDGQQAGGAEDEKIKSKRLPPSHWLQTACRRMHLNDG